MVVHVPTQETWFDLYLDVFSRHLGFATEEYSSEVKNVCDLDGYCFLWNIPKILGKDQMPTYQLVKDPGTRREVAQASGLFDFDPQLANHAIEYDGIIFLNHELIDQRIKFLGHDPDFCRRNGFKVEDYLKLLITHESINLLEDADRQSIIVGLNPGVPFDKPTLETFDAYVGEHSKE